MFYVILRIKKTIMAAITLITGGQRSGKSRYAERLALSLSEAPIYMATARVEDDEFRRRVEKHQSRRGKQWTTIEEGKFLSRHNAFLHDKVVLIDCVTLWCSNFFADSCGEGKVPSVDAILAEMEAEFDRLTSQRATFIFVTNEIGSGGVSVNAAQRAFTDLQGWLNQYIAERADEVILMVSGIAVKIK